MKQLVPALFTAGAIMALTGAAVFITGWIYAPYIYTVGAGCIALAQVNTPVKGKSKTFLICADICAFILRQSVNNPCKLSLLIVAAISACMNFFFVTHEVHNSNVSKVNKVIFFIVFYILSGYV